MNSTIDLAAYSDALVVLGTAGILVPILSRLGFNPVLSYLAAGALLGPLGLGSLIQAGLFCSGFESLLDTTEE